MLVFMQAQAFARFGGLCLAVAELQRGEGGIGLVAEHVLPKHRAGVRFPHSAL
jgi:hypothetical protein